MQLARQEKQALEMSVKELQIKLAELEKPDFSSGASALNKSLASSMFFKNEIDMSTLEASLKREKQLEIMVCIIRNFTSK